MTRRFDLIALDMDGTLLNSQKEISLQNQETINLALSQGREVVLCTGRARAETDRFLKWFPGMHYLLCESGALLVDLRENKILFREVIRHTDLEQIFAAVGDRDIMPVAFSGGSYYANRSQIGRLAYYQMEPYAAETPAIATLTENLRSDILSGRLEVEKLNLFHTSPRERQQTWDFLAALPQPLETELVLAEASSLECSPRGVHKGAALEKLSNCAGIPAERMIMVGDADNDLTALQFAGLAVAMGNANEHVRAVCDAVVDDNDHDGCAQAIRRFLL